MKKIFFVLLVSFFIFVFLYRNSLKIFASTMYTRIWYVAFVPQSIPRPTDKTIIDQSSIEVGCDGFGLMPVGSVTTIKTVIKGSGQRVVYSGTIGGNKFNEQVSSISTTTYASIFYEAYDKNIFALEKLRTVVFNKFQLSPKRCVLKFRVGDRETIIDSQNIYKTKEHDILMNYIRAIEGI